MTLTTVWTNAEVSSRRYLYTGKERDTESGNDYFGARYYSSAMGRFMSPDRPVDQHTEDPQSLNLYSYVRNRPLTSTDPTGNFDCQGGASQCFDAKLAAIKEKEASFDVNNPNLFALQKVSGVLGNYGDHNGVTVNFADLGGSANDHVGAQTVDKTITFNSSFSMSTDTMAATLIHEGTHVLQNEIADQFKKNLAGGLVDPSGLLPTNRPSWTGLVKEETEAYTNQGYAEQALHIKGQIYDPTDTKPGADKRRENRIGFYARASANKTCGSGSLEAEGSKCTE
jgi:RHS repeat-associated protein